MTDTILGRLIAHWPTIGGPANDPAALARLTDWRQAIRNAGPRADPICDELITTWTERRAPHLGDWQAAARTVAARHHLEDQARELTSPPAPRDPKIGLAGIAACREILARTPRYTGLRRPV